MGEMYAEMKRRGLMGGPGPETVERVAQRLGGPIKTGHMSPTMMMLDDVIMAQMARRHKQQRSRLRLSQGAFRGRS